jgi:hypothetical protein
VAFATTTDIVALFLGIIVTAIAKMLLNAADIIVTPLLAITSMTTQEIEAYIPGLNNSDPNGVGNFFSSAISIIAYTIAGVLLCCHIISYLIALANDERLESIPKLIWNGMFGIVLTIAGKNLLSLLFNEIIAPLSEALVDGMQSAGGMSFTFEGKANDIISLGDGISAFDLSALGTLLVVLAMLFLIWWNLVKLILECAQRYIICVVTINLSPLAFATATTEQTKETAMNWLKMFWSQCVLLVLNIWVVGIARTALNNGMIGGSSTELVTWALITYAFLKIAQKLDDMMQAAGLKVTRMNGIDPLSEASGVMNQLTGIGAHLRDALGYSKGVLDTVRGNKGSEGGKPMLTEEDIAHAESDFDKTDIERKSDLNKGAINPTSYDDDAHKKAMENVLKTEGVLNGDEQVEGVKIGEDGSLHATAVKRDDRGRVASSREIKATNTGDGLGLTPDETPTSTMRVGNGGKSAIISNEKGTFKLEAQGKNDLGENVWKATQLTDADGNKISDIAPGADASQVFTVDADWDDDAQHKKDGYAASAAAYFTENQDTNESMMDDLARWTDYAAEDKRSQDKAEQRDFTNKIGMTDEDRIANMMDSEAAVDYNSDNAKKAMEDYIMDNKDQNPGLAPFAEALENGGHISSMSMADGSNPAVPQGALQFEITRPKAPGDKNPDITAGAISNPATAMPTPAKTSEVSPVQNEQPESLPTAKQDAQGEESANAGQTTAQSADASAVDKKVDEEPAPVDAEVPLESPSVPETPNGAPTGEVLDNSAVVGDESPIEAATKPNAEQEVHDTVGVEQSIETTAPIDATQPLDGGITPKAEDIPEVDSPDAVGGTPVVDTADTASNEPQGVNIPATEQAAGETQFKPDALGEVPQTPTTGAQAETGAVQSRIAPEAIQGQETAPIASEASQPAASVSAKQPDSTTAGSPDAIQTQNPATTTTTPASDGTPYMSGEGATQTTVDATPENAGQAAQVVIDATAPTDNDSAVTVETAPTDSDAGSIAESYAAASDASVVDDEPETAYSADEVPAQSSTSPTTHNASEESDASNTTETHEPGNSSPMSETSGNDSGYEPTDRETTDSFESEDVSGEGLAATSPSNDSNVAASSSDSGNDAGDEPDSAYTPHSSSDDGVDDETVHDASSVTDKHSDNASYNEDADDVDTATFEADDAPIADGAGFYGEGTGNSFKESKTKSTTDSNESPAVESGAQSNPTDEPDATAGTVTETTAVPDAKQDVGEAASQVQAEAVTQQSSEQAETVSIPSVPQGIVLSNTSVNKLSDTNGTIRSASAGVFQLTREGLDEDTGKTVWRATLKQDAEGNPVTDYSANTFTFERTAKWNAQTRSYQPEGFDSVAKEVREAVDFRDISQSANQGRGSRRSDKPQNQPERERFKRERNPKAYTDDARLTEGRRTTSTSRGGKHRAQRKSDTAKKRDNPLKNMDGFKTKR